ncbi:hypothetical protein NDU88_000659 [Pleurodeles waltl]|uniref:Uncharacterized protein n=1 Tax=Pleurodeles waltl TaxID=8319 RepID=A0AAV7S7K2_PLEWA|nr:hypothetical protein NDU88_000659 [Pleurodeles waltl]
MERSGCPGSGLPAGLFGSKTGFFGIEKDGVEDGLGSENDFRDLDMEERCLLGSETELRLESDGFRGVAFGVELVGWSLSVFFRVEPWFSSSGESKA